MSVARQNYLARKRSDETPLEYLHCLNVAAKLAKIAIKEERLATAATRREHVEHFIATLDDRDLAKQLTLLRLRDIDEMEDTLRACQRVENLQIKIDDGIKQFHQRAIAPTNPMASKTTRVMRSIREKSKAADRNRSRSDPKRKWIVVAFV